LWYATQEGIDACYAGNTASQVADAMQQEISKRLPHLPPTTTGRSGHALGLDLTEGLSFAHDDHTELKVGMVLTIEPGVSIDSHRMLVHEENLVITEDGPKMLSSRAPMDMIRLECLEMSSTMYNGFDEKEMFDPEPDVVFGFVQLASDLRLDIEAPGLLSQLDQDVRWRFQKLHMPSETISKSNLKELGSSVQDAGNVFLPPDSLTVVGLACTSLSFVLGPDEVRKRLQGEGGDRHVVDMATSVKQALRALDANRVALLTPYLDEVHEENVRFLSEEVNVVVSKNLGLETDKETSRVSQNYLRRAARDLILNKKESNDDNVDTLMIGCSAFQACTSNGFIDLLESELGVRVVTSQQALLWEMCRTCDIDTSGVVGYGELMRVCV